MEIFLVEINNIRVFHKKLNNLFFWDTTPNSEGAFCSFKFLSHIRCKDIRVENQDLESLCIIHIEYLFQKRKSFIDLFWCERQQSVVILDNSMDGIIIQVVLFLQESSELNDVLLQMTVISVVDSKCWNLALEDLSKFISCESKLLELLKCRLDILFEIYSLSKAFFSSMRLIILDILTNTSECISCNCWCANSINPTAKPISANDSTQHSLTISCFNKKKSSL